MTKSFFRFAFLDIDFTLSSQVHHVKELMEKLKTAGYTIGFATTRTEEMLMDAQAYSKSLDLGFTRPLHKNKNIHPLLINPDIILASTGTEIMVKQENGAYLKDFSYEKHIPNNWRQETLQLLKEIDPDNKLFSLAPIEFEENYQTGSTDVFPTSNRIHINFISLNAKIEFLKKLQERTTYETFFMPNANAKLTIIDDSDPKENRYTIHLTPTHMDKGYAIDHILKKINPEQTELLIAGDSYPDLSMLLRSGSQTKAAAIVVGGARITDIFIQNNLHSFAGENISSFHAALKPGTTKGEYCYQYGNNTRRIIVGDQMFPGTFGPGTILRYLDQQST